LQIAECGLADCGLGIADWLIADCGLGIEDWVADSALRGPLAWIPIQPELPNFEALAISELFGNS
jgi:hypothetical protein